MRTATACAVCRSRKQKCHLSKSTTQLICNFCYTHKIPCSLSRRESAVKGKKSLEYATQMRIIRSMPAKDMDNYELPPADVCRDLINLYFYTLDNTDTSLFHHRSFMDSFERGDLPVVTLLSMFSLTARFSEHAYFEGKHRWMRGDEWAQEAKTLLNLQTISASLAGVQSCRLLSSVLSAEGDIDGVSFCNAITSCIAPLLGLPQNLSSNPLQREIEVRVWSTIYITDVWVSASRNLKRSPNLEPMFLWPVNELTFRNMSHNTLDDEATPDDAHSRRTGLWSQMIPLTKLFGQVNDLNYSLVDCCDVQENNLDTVMFLSDGLAQWQLDLPSQLRESQTNLSYFSRRGLGHVFVALHVGFHYYHVLLFYRFLQLDSTNSLASYYAFQCKSHATAISNLVWSAHDQFSVDCVWVRVSHVLVISSSVHLHTLLLESNPEAVNEARRLLERNFQLLLKLRRYWPWIDQAMRRLKAFQEACLRAQEVSDVFRMSDWLVRFLQKYNNTAMEEDVQTPTSEVDLFCLEDWSK